MQNKLQQYSAELQAELVSILSYWQKYTPDLINGGFTGKIDHDNVADAKAPKGAVLNARILWSFSAAYNQNPQAGYLEMAKRAYDYIVEHFIDRDFGGVYWTVDYKGLPLDPKKQVYAIAFTIYALSEYFIASKNEAARLAAAALSNDLIKHSYDHLNGGYFEAYTREWLPIEDLRLSDKDANEKKTMNTHLHVLEAFTTLYKIYPGAELKLKITALLNDFTTKLIDQDSMHLVLFFDEYWNRKSEIISYGHDIEASWLLLEAAEAIADHELIEQIKVLSVKMSETALKGLDKDGGMWYEYDPSGAFYDKDRHWWVQAEAMIGFFNAWQISDSEIYLNASMASWQFIKSKIIDKVNGEWYWGITEEGNIMPGQDKVGLWKCPYHNSRACLEILKRIASL